MPISPYMYEPDDVLIARTAWLYYIGGLNQEETAVRLGVHRSRVNRLLSEARERGLVSITIQHDAARLLELEHSIERQYGLEFCLCTPPIGFDLKDKALAAMHSVVARRAVGSAAASFLRGWLESGKVTVGVSWGRTVEQVALQLAGVKNPRARFVSLMGSLTRNSASNPFEVVHAFAGRTGGEGHFLPVPFVADTEADRDVLMSQRSVAEAVALAHVADLYLISVGELSEHSILRMQGMLSRQELRSVRKDGAVCDTLGRLFDVHGQEVEHELSRRTLAVDVQKLRGRNVVLLAAGGEKLDATQALLRSGLIRSLIIDGDMALCLRLSST